MFSVAEEEGEGDSPVPEPEGHLRFAVLPPQQDEGGHGLQRILGPVLLHHDGNGM